MFNLNDLLTDDLFSSGFPTFTTTTAFKSDYPKTSCFMEDGVISLLVATTGFKKEEVTVTVEGDTLIVKGKKEKKVESTEGDKKETKKTVFWNDIAQRRFTLEYTLAPTIDKETIEAKNENGILTITIKLKEKEVKKISING